MNALGRSGTFPCIKGCPAVRTAGVLQAHNGAARNCDGIFIRGAIRSCLAAWTPCRPRYAIGCRCQRNASAASYRKACGRMPSVSVLLSDGAPARTVPARFPWAPVSLDVSARYGCSKGNAPGGWPWRRHVPAPRLWRSGSPKARRYRSSRRRISSIPGSTTQPVSRAAASVKQETPLFTGRPLR